MTVSFFVKQKSICIIGFVSIIIVVGLNSWLFVMMNKHLDIAKARTSLYDIKTAILEANVAIRAAAAASSEHQRKIELDKRFITRSTADRSYSKLASISPCDVCKALLEDMIKHRNGAYRTTQNQAVKAIVDNKSPELVWEAIHTYSREYQLYLWKVTELINTSGHEAAEAHYYMKMALAINFVFSLNIVVVFIIRKIMCSDCPLEGGQ